MWHWSMPWRLTSVAPFGKIAKEYPKTYLSEIYPSLMKAPENEKVRRLLSCESQGDSHDLEF